MSIIPVNLSEITFPQSIAVCPYDAASLKSIMYDRDAEAATVQYHCGTTRHLGFTDAISLGQSQPCVVKQLELLLQSESDIQASLEEANRQNALLVEQLTAKGIIVDELRQEIAALEGGVTANKAVGFKLEFGTPVAKG